MGTVLAIGPGPMHRCDQDHGPFHLKIDPTVWKMLDAISSTAFRRIQHELEGIAALASLPRSPNGKTRPRTLHIEVDGFVAEYDVDSTRRVVTLQSIRAIDPK